MKLSFKLFNSTSENEYLGVITDGTYKLDVLLYKNKNDVNIERGTKLELIGDIQESGTNFYLYILKLNK